MAGGKTPMADCGGWITIFGSSWAVISARELTPGREYRLPKDLGSIWNRLEHAPSDAGIGDTFWPKHTFGGKASNLNVGAGRVARPVAENRPEASRGADWPNTAVQTRRTRQGNRITYLPCSQRRAGRGEVSRKPFDFEFFAGARQGRTLVRTGVAGFSRLLCGFSFQSR